MAHVAVLAPGLLSFAFDNPRSDRVLSGPSASAAVQIVNNRPGTFVDIKDTGLPLNLHGDLSAAVTTTIGNSVFPAGRVVIANNGGIGFDPTDDFLDPNPEAIPSNRAFGGSKCLLPYWSDIGNHVGNVYVEEVNSVLVIQWDHKKFEGFPNAAAVTFQVQIRGTVQDDIVAQMLYQTIEEGPAFGGANGGVGYQDGIGGSLNDVQYAVGEAFSVSDLEVLTVLAPSPGTGLVTLLGLGLLTRRRR